MKNDEMTTLTLTRREIFQVRAALLSYSLECSDFESKVSRFALLMKVVVQFEAQDGEEE